MQLSGNVHRDVCVCVCFFHLPVFHKGCEVAKTHKLSKNVNMDKSQSRRAQVAWERKAEGKVLQTRRPESSGHQPLGAKLPGIQAKRKTQRHPRLVSSVS